MAITKTSMIPFRIDMEHYQIESESRPGKWYQLTFNRELKKWECDPSCPDLKYNGNKNCRHLYALRQYIREQKALADGEQPVQAQESRLREDLEGMRLDLAAYRDRIIDLEIQHDQMQQKLDQLKNDNFSIRKMRSGLHLVGRHKVFGHEFATACECLQSRSGKECPHMQALNKFLG